MHVLMLDHCTESLHSCTSVFAFSLSGERGRVGLSYRKSAAWYAGASREEQHSLIPIEGSWALQFHPS